jgi:two-component system, sensor histidine kinase and response regulator
MSSPVVVLDPAGRVLATNPAAHTVLALPPDAAHLPLDVTFRSARDGPPVHLNRDSPDGLEFIADFGGAQREFVLSRTPLTAPNGRAFGCLLVMEDPALEVARKREASLLSLDLPLSNLPEKARGESLSVLGHEVRTPLNVIIGSANLLAGESLSSRQRDYADMIYSSAQSLLTILNDILDVRRVDAGRLTLDETTFDLRSLVEDVVESFVPPTEACGLQLILSCEACLDGTYLGDPVRLKQVLRNLIDNAVKFTIAGSVTVCVRKAEDSQFVEVSVTDTGVGIDLSVQQHLFDAFRQVDSSTTRRFGGTGLGLALAKRLVTMMGGAIGCESNPREGSRFWFSVPLRLVSQHPIPQRPGRCVLVSSATEPAARLSAVLQLIGYECKIAGSPEAVLDNPPTLLVIDPGWPGFSSPESIAALVALARKVGSVTIAVLASARSVAQEEWSKGLVLLQEPWLLRKLAPVVGPPSARVPKGAVTRASYAGYRLLLVEDNPLNRKLARHMLGTLGCAVDEATTGLEAVTCVQCGRYDLILMDLQMPGVDGFEATRRIRQRESEHGMARTPIVAFSAGTLSSEHVQAREAGMDGFLAKPVDKERLLSVCVQWFERATPEHRTEGA